MPPLGERRPTARRACALAALLLLAPAVARAAPPWVYRHLTLPSGDWAFDFGAGVGHIPAPRDDTAVGVNLEMAVAIDRVELGVRTGLRPGNEPDRLIGADGYGRLFDRQYFDPGDGVVADPEVRVRVAILRGPVADLAVEGRVIVPVVANRAGLEPGLPLAFHLGRHVRLDTGVWLPIIVGDALPVGISMPLDVWFQVSHRLWLGPMTGVVVAPLGANPSTADLSLGFGLGYQLARAVDFKTMFLFPALNQDSRFFGAGAGLQLRVE
jgi:hypothetical protein